MAKPLKSKLGNGSGDLGAREPIFKSTMAGFRAVYHPLRETGATAVPIPKFDTSTTQPPVLLITIANLHEIPRLFDALSQIIETDPEEGPPSEEDVIGSALSILCCVTPGIVALFVKELRDLSFHIKVQTLSQYTAEHGGESERLYTNVRECLILFGQVALMLIKNMTEANFVNYFAQRTKAMRARIGVRASNTIEIFFSLDQAETIRSMLGGHPAIRARIVRLCLDLSMRDPLGLIGQICGYVCDMAAWTDMTPLVFIYENLVVPGSAVMRVKSVRAEVINVVKAYDQVDAFEYPQFFRILAPKHLQAAVLRSNFPTLVAVAQRLRSEQFVTVGQFAGTMETVSSARVEELLAIHRAGTIDRESRLYKAALRYIDDPEDREANRESGDDHEPSPGGGAGPSAPRA